VHGNKPKKPLNLLSMSPHVGVHEPAESFARYIHDFYLEIHKQFQTSNIQYNFHIDVSRYHMEFPIEDYAII
jgi:hypothetical protein